MGKNVVKGYKIFNYDWKCRGFQYEVGKTYTYNGKLELCGAGFHFCTKLEDCFQFYDPISWNHIAEVEALGKVIYGDDGLPKCVTNKIRIIKEIKLTDVYGKRAYVQSKGKYGSMYLNEAYGVHTSSGINKSYGIALSHGVHDSSGIDESDGISCSLGVYASGMTLQARGVAHAQDVYSVYGVCDVKGAIYSGGIKSSVGVVNSKGVFNSFGVISSNGISNGLFVANMEPSYLLFNKKVTAGRFYEVKDSLFHHLGGWAPTCTDFKKLKLESGGDWYKTPINHAKYTYSWESMPKEAIDYLKSLPEFDPEIFKIVTGIEV